MRFRGWRTSIPPISWPPKWRLTPSLACPVMMPPSVATLSHTPRNLKTSPCWAMLDHGDIHFQRAVDFRTRILRIHGSPPSERAHRRSPEETRLVRSAVALSSPNRIAFARAKRALRKQELFERDAEFHGSAALYPLRNRNSGSASEADSPTLRERTGDVLHAFDQRLHKPRR